MSVLDRNERGQFVAPTRITDIVAHTAEGHPIRAGERIIMSIRAGAFPTVACAAAGVTSPTLQTWLRDGARAVGKITADPLYRPSDHERECIDFSYRFAQAEAEAEMNAVLQLERLARGGIEIQTVTEKYDANGALSERTVRKDYTLPDRQVLQWRLARRAPQRWGERVTVAVESAQDEERLDRLANLFEGWVEARSEAIETTGTET